MDRHVGRVPLYFCSHFISMKFLLSRLIFRFIFEEKVHHLVYRVTQLLYRLRDNVRGETILWRRQDGAVPLINAVRVRQ